MEWIESSERHEREPAGLAAPRTHLYGGFGGFAANPLHLQQKRAPGVEHRARCARLYLPCKFRRQIQAEQAPLLSGWQGRRRGIGTAAPAPQFARLRAAKPALAKALQMAVKCRQRV
jgi:hypothetical protein